jgi:hypothetical protein
MMPETTVPLSIATRRSSSRCAFVRELLWPSHIH